MTSLGLNSAPTQRTAPSAAPKASAQAPAPVKQAAAQKSDELAVDALYNTIKNAANSYGLALPAQFTELYKANRHDFNNFYSANRNVIDPIAQMIEKIIRKAAVILVSKESKKVTAAFLIIFSIILSKFLTPDSLV